jgi:hypothetical protein
MMKELQEQNSNSEISQIRRFCTQCGLINSRVPSWDAFFYKRRLHLMSTDWTIPFNALSHGLWLSMSGDSRRRYSNLITLIWFTVWTLFSLGYVLSINWYVHRHAEESWSSMKPVCDNMWWSQLKSNVELLCFFALAGFEIVHFFTWYFCFSGFPLLSLFLPLIYNGLSSILVSLRPSRHRCCWLCVLLFE